MLTRIVISHVNIINLLGSIVDNIKKGEIYAILELSQYGNLKDFVYCNSKHFTDQINHEENYIAGSEFGKTQTNNKNPGYRFVNSCSLKFICNIEK